MSLNNYSALPKLAGSPPQGQDYATLPNPYEQYPPRTDRLPADRSFYPERERPPHAFPVPPPYRNGPPPQYYPPMENMYPPRIPYGRPDARAQYAAPPPPPFVPQSRFIIENQNGETHMMSGEAIETAMRTGRVDLSKPVEGTTRSGGESKQDETHKSLQQMTVPSPPGESESDHTQKASNSKKRTTSRTVTPRVASSVKKPKTTKQAKSDEVAHHEQVAAMYEEFSKNAPVSIKVQIRDLSDIIGEGAVKCSNILEDTPMFDFPLHKRANPQRKESRFTAKEVIDYMLAELYDDQATKVGGQKLSPEEDPFEYMSVKVQAADDAYKTLKDVRSELKPFLDERAQKEAENKKVTQMAQTEQPGLVELIKTTVHEMNFPSEQSMVASVMEKIMPIITSTVESMMKMKSDAAQTNEANPSPLFSGNDNYENLYAKYASAEVSSPQQKAVVEDCPESE